MIQIEAVELDQPGLIPSELEVGFQPTRTLPDDNVRNNERYGRLKWAYNPDNTYGDSHHT